ncbi:MAG: hypothetical protein K9K38_20990 [Rhodoferax sp.]|nr:hypothetical protein [Rhodoferax sp.]
MDTTFENEGVDAVLERHLVSGEISTIASDWIVVTDLLPAHWQAKASELGAIQGRMRGFRDVECLLRVMLTHPRFPS